MIELFAAQTANANGSSFDWPGGAKAATFVGYGTWDTSTLTLEMSPDGGTTWIPVTGMSLTANGHLDIPPLGSGVQVRAVLASVGGTTSINARIF